MRKCLPKASAAFTLIELLAVIGVVSVLMTLSILGVGSLGQARHLDAALWGIIGTIEQAHIIARARNLHVWVGLAPMTKQGVEGTGVVVFTDQSGLKQETISSDSSSLTPLTPVSFFRGAQIVSKATEQGEVNLGNISGQLGNYHARMGAETVEFPFLICISPTGEVFSADGISPRTLIISVASTRLTPNEKAAVGTVRLGGVSGKLEVATETWDSPTRL